MALFRGEISPGPAIIEDVANGSPSNPFCTASYVLFRAGRGDMPALLALEYEGRLVTGCFGFMSFGWRSRVLEIPSAPDTADPACFWNGVESFCRRHWIDRLRVLTFASENPDIPSLGTELRREGRSEFVLDFAPDGVWNAISENHKRNLRKARNEGIDIRSTMDFMACDDHVRLMDDSLTRRSRRGEEVGHPGDVERFRDLIRSGAGQLFQACAGGRVLSSILVLLARRGAYYHSAGTSAEGMAKGASHYLITSTADELQRQGMSRFNLGGAAMGEQGLRRFKSGFGAREVSLEAAEFEFGNAVGNTFRAAACKLL